MSFWKRESNQSKAVQTSEQLVKKRSALEAKWPQVEAEWNKIDEQEVLPAAAKLSVALLAENPDRLISAREALKQALWKRDGVNGAYQRAVSELNGELEVLNAPVIAETIRRWHGELNALGGERVVEIDEKLIDLVDDRMPKSFRLRSNLAAITEAREALLDAIRTLKEMNLRSLSEVSSFIEAIEARMQKMDLTKLATAAEAISEAAFHDIISRPDVEVRPAPGSTNRIYERFFRADKFQRA